MLWNTMKRLVAEDDGMEMIEWSLVGTVFAVGAAVVWGSLNDGIGAALENVSNCVADSSDCA